MERGTPHRLAAVFPVVEAVKAESCNESSSRRVKGKMAHDDAPHQRRHRAAEEVEMRRRLPGSKSWTKGNGGSERKRHRP
jgi:hypothetical protein